MCTFLCVWVLRMCVWCVQVRTKGIPPAVHTLTRRPPFQEVGHGRNRMVRVVRLSVRWQRQRKHYVIALPNLIGYVRGQSSQDEFVFFFFQFLSFFFHMIFHPVQSLWHLKAHLTVLQHSQNAGLHVRPKALQQQHWWNLLYGNKTP